MNLRVLAGSLLGAVVVALLPLPARACLRSMVAGPSDDRPGPCLWWDTRQPTWSMHGGASRRVLPKGSERAAVAAGFRTWSEAGCSDLAFEELAPTDRTDVGYDPESPDNVNLVIVRDRSCAEVVPASDACWQLGGCGNVYRCWDQSSDAIAITTTSFNNRTGELYDADIELNGGSFLFTTVDGPPCPEDAVDREDCIATDLANTITHEVGHFLGLDHSEARDATMYRSADIGETSKRRLHADDLSCFCAMYPPGRDALTCVQPDPKVAIGDGCAGCGSAGGPSIPLLLAALAVLGVSRRRPNSLTALRAESETRAS